LPEPFKDRTYQIVVSALSFTLLTVSLFIVCCLRRQIKICKSFTIQPLES